LRNEKAYLRKNIPKFKLLNLKYQINLLAYHSEVQSFNINKVWKQEPRWRVGGKKRFGGGVHGVRLWWDIGSGKVVGLVTMGWLMDDGVLQVEALEFGNPVVKTCCKPCCIQFIVPI